MYESIHEVDAGLPISSSGLNRTAIESEFRISLSRVHKAKRIARQPFFMSATPGP
ncbi:MAG: hypothetical protein SPK70_06665 [Succinivibrio dextrinosolvens]|nr:hypothetical protein [Succinivibrio dextrinosolvens]